MGLHTGEGRIGAGSYVGIEVHRAARIGSAGHGGRCSSRPAPHSSANGLCRRGVADGSGGPSAEGPDAAGAHLPSGASGARRPVPAPDDPHGPPEHLPTQTSELLGRDRELREIRDLLDDPDVRLLTLVGPGGIGKTRLAVQVGAEHADLAPDGVYFVDLSPITDADSAFDAVARAVGASGTGGPLDLLREHLASRRVLLVLDNLEQVMDAAGGIADLLRFTSGLRVLVTSREALRIRGERLFAVQPLTLPGDVASADTVERSAAGRLFVERARDVRPGFDLTDEDAAAVAEICVRLDGLPLAIELAAARIALFSPGELLDRLREHAGVLGGDARDLPERQQTLRSTIEWSERLLDEDERSTFRLFSVFASARIEAVEAVASRLNGGGTGVLPRLVSLVDKSLVRSLDEDGHRRLAMLETIRDYAATRLDELPEERDAARLAHAEYFADVAQEGRERLNGRERPVVLAELVADLGNLRAAWRYSVQAGDLGRLDAMLDALWTLHDDRGWYHGHRPLERPALCALHCAGDGGAHRPGVDGADEPGARPHRDPRVHQGGRGHLRDCACPTRGDGWAMGRVAAAAEPRQPVPVSG